MIYCGACKKNKMANEFPPSDKSNPRGSRCRDCRKAKMRERRNEEAKRKKKRSAFFTGGAFGALLLFALPALAETADEASKHHPAEWSGAWIYEMAQSCCGRNDCHPANANPADPETLPGLTVVRDDAAGGYVVTIPQDGDQLPWTEMVQFEDQRIQPGMDPEGRFWVCTVMANGTKKVRCLFIAPLGF
jgi:hypothetical protein